MPHLFLFTIFEGIPEAGAMDQFFQTVVEYVYVAPHKLEEFKKSLKKK